MGVAQVLAAQQESRRRRIVLGLSSVTQDGHIPKHEDRQGRPGGGSGVPQTKAASTRPATSPVLLSQRQTMAKLWRLHPTAMLLAASANRASARGPKASGLQVHPSWRKPLPPGLPTPAQVLERPGSRSARVGSGFQGGNPEDDIADEQSQFEEFESVSLFARSAWGLLYGKRANLQHGQKMAALMNEATRVWRRLCCEEAVRSTRYPDALSPAAQKRMARLSDATDKAAKYVQMQMAQMLARDARLQQIFNEDHVPSVSELWDILLELRPGLLQPDGHGQPWLRLTLIIRGQLEMEVMSGCRTGVGARSGDVDSSDDESEDQEDYLVTISALEVLISAVRGVVLLSAAATTETPVPDDLCEPCACAALYWLHKRINERVRTARASAASPSQGGMQDLQPCEIPPRMLYDVIMYDYFCFERPERALLRLAAEGVAERHGDVRTTFCGPRPPEVPRFHIYYFRKLINLLSGAESVSMQLGQLCCSWLLRLVGSGDCDARDTLTASLGMLDAAWRYYLSPSEKKQLEQCQGKVLRAYGRFQQERQRQLAVKSEAFEEGRPHLGARAPSPGKGQRQEEGRRSGAAVAVAAAGGDGVGQVRLERLHEEEDAHGSKSGSGSGLGSALAGQGVQPGWQQGLQRPLLPGCNDGGGDDEVPSRRVRFGLSGDEEGASDGNGDGVTGKPSARGRSNGAAAAAYGSYGSDASSILSTSHTKDLFDSDSSDDIAKAPPTRLYVLRRGRSTAATTTTANPQQRGSGVKQGETPESGGGGGLLTSGPDLSPKSIVDVLLQLVQRCHVVPAVQCDGFGVCPAAAEPPSPPLWQLAFQGSQRLLLVGAEPTAAVLLMMKQLGFFNQVVLQVASSSRLAGQVLGQDQAEVFPPPPGEPGAVLVTLHSAQERRGRLQAGRPDGTAPARDAGVSYGGRDEGRAAAVTTERTGNAEGDVRRQEEERRAGGACCGGRPAGWAESAGAAGLPAGGPAEGRAATARQEAAGAERGKGEKEEEGQKKELQQQETKEVEWIDWPQSSDHVAPDEDFFGASVTVTAVSNWSEQLEALRLGLLGRHLGSALVHADGVEGIQRALLMAAKLSLELQCTGAELLVAVLDVYVTAVGAGGELLGTRQQQQPQPQSDHDERESSGREGEVEQAARASPSCRGLGRSREPPAAGCTDVCRVLASLDCSDRTLQVPAAVPSPPPSSSAAATPAATTGSRDDVNACVQRTGRTDGCDSGEAVTVGKGGAGQVPVSGAEGAASGAAAEALLPRADGGQGPAASAARPGPGPGAPVDARAVRLAERVLELRTATTVLGVGASLAGGDCCGSRMTGGLDPPPDPPVRLRHRDLDLLLEPKAACEDARALLEELSTAGSRLRERMRVVFGFGARGPWRGAASGEQAGRND